MKNQRRLLLAALLCVFLTGCGITSQTQKASTMTNGTSTATNTTFCIGRFLIDLPAGARQTGGDYKYDFMRIEKPLALTFEQFEKEVEARSTKLKSIKHEKEPHLLRKIVHPDTSSRALAFWEEHFSEYRVRIEGYRWIDGTRFLIKDEVDDDKQEFGIKRMTDALTRLRPRADTDIPADPGFCFAGGFIANERWRNEEAGVDFRLPDHPDVIVSVWFYPLASYKRDKPLLERVGGVLGLLGNLATSVHILRHGERRVGPYQGQEYLVSAPNSGGRRAHSFVWETQGEGTLDAPRIKIELSSGHQDGKGNAQPTRLSNEQALRLWDEIVDTFRLRPTGGPAKSGAAAPPLRPLGELVATGYACPQTGWWECVEEGEVCGERRRHFQAGERMPHATLWGDPNLWQKLRGERPVHRTGTLWRLVAYGDAPPAETAGDLPPPGET